MNNAVQGMEIRYLNMEKLALPLVIAWQKLQPYFQSHNIEVLTSFLLKQVLQKLYVSRRLMKWVVELGQFEIRYKR